MKTLKFIGTMAVLITLLSCEKEIEYQGEGKAPVLVLDAILENHASPIFHVSRSVFFLSNSTDPAAAAISDAEIIFTNVTENKFTTNSGGIDGYYYGFEPIQPNTVYRIEVRHPKYPTISSEITTVKDIPISKLDTSGINENYGRTYLVGTHFSDPVDQQFYAFSYQAKEETIYYNPDSSIFQVDTLYKFQYTESEDPSLGFYHSNHLWISDPIFNGKEKVFAAKCFYYPPYYYDEDVYSHVIGWRVGLTVYSESVYKYYKTLGGNQANGPFNDPANVYTNITNGLGVFGSFSRTFMEI
jgi:hypothetical protein